MRFEVWKGYWTERFRAWAFRGNRIIGSGEGKTEYQAIESAKANVAQKEQELSSA